jgi:hypothetical protein
MKWWKDRLSSLLDNLIWVALAVVIGAQGASLIAFGNRSADLPIWAVALFGGVLLGCVGSLVILFRRLGAKAQSGTADAPHPHDQLLRRIDGLNAAVRSRRPDDVAEWAAAAAFNGILHDAKAQSNSPRIEDIEPLEPGDQGGWAYSATYGTIVTLLALIRSNL